MNSGPVRDQILNSVHRRAKLLARATAPGATARSVDSVLSEFAWNATAACIVLLGETFCRRVLEAVFDGMAQAQGVCRFCREGELVPDKGMCATCWQESEQEARVVDEQMAMERPIKGTPS